MLRLGANVDALDSEGITPLVASLRKNDPSTMMYLIERGANTDVRDMGGNTVLHRYLLPDKIYIYISSSSLCF